MCLNGNCLGCADSKLWCLDPKCYPNCSGCSGNIPLEPLVPAQIQPNDIGVAPSATEDSWKIVVVVISFVFIAFIIGLVICGIIYRYGSIPSMVTPETVLVSTG